MQHLWHWVKIGAVWFPAMRDGRSAGGWSNGDTWEDFRGEVRGSVEIPLPDEIRKGEEMTERIKGLTVLLEPDKRDDDAECIVAAIRMIRGVVSVATHIADIDHHFAVETVRREMTAKLWDALNSTRGGKGESLL